ncbi:MAG: sigma-54 dependent transcriptional regulator [Phycisphaerales bacterium]
MNSVLIVDDKEMMRDSVGATLQRAGFAITTVEGGEAALAAIAARRPDAVVTDMKMPGMTGLELLERVRRIDEDLPVVIMTAFAGVDSAVRAIKLGAFDYITKPFEGDELVISVKRAINHARLVRENALLRAVSGDQSSVTGESGGSSAEGHAPRGLDRIFGVSPAIRRVKEQVMAVAESAGTVMVCGESGSGKEVIARAIHDLSPRKAAPYLAVNCAALSEALLESELFGHERGAFTGAEKLRKGRFELADGGTLLLDEVSEIGSHIQAKLLRVLQERAFERVGSSLTIGSDVRVVATSNRDLPQAVGRGEFRQDLFFRLNVLPIHLPPLRDRAEDVPLLAAHFIREIGRREGRAGLEFDAGALSLLQSYAWPGNVRELQNICERAVVLCSVRAGRIGPAGNKVIGREVIEPWLLSAGAARPQAQVEAKPFQPVPAPAYANGNGAHAPGHNGVNGHGVSPIEPPAITVKPLEDLEREAIVFALRRFNGHRQKTAAALGIGVRTLGLKLKKWKQERLVSETL